MRREVAQAAVQPTERVTERSRLEVNGDVGLGLHAEQRREPSRTDGMPGEPPQRMSAHDAIAIHRVLAKLPPRDRLVAFQPIGHRGGEPFAFETVCADTESSQAITRLRTCRIERCRRRRGEDHEDLTGVQLAVADLVGPVLTHGGIETRVRSGHRCRFGGCEPAHADQQLHRAIERLAHARECGGSGGLARRVERLDVEIAGGEHRGHDSPALAPVRSDHNAFAERRTGSARARDRAEGQAGHAERSSLLTRRARRRRAIAAGPDSSRPMSRCAFSAVITASSSGMSPIS